jgi:hypothetical protein
LRRFRDTLIAAAAVLLVVPCGAWSQTTPPAAPAAGTPAEGAAPPVEQVEVDGFRTARWGMTDAQVKAAIRKDFDLPPEKLQSEENPSDRTTVLTATVPNLLEGTGLARVSYIFGYATKKLIQVNIVLGTPVDPQSKSEKIVAAANQLRQLFLDSGYRPETIVVNTKMADGSVVVFEGQDAQKRTTLLRLIASEPAAAPAKPEKGAKAVPATPPAGGGVALFLSYILDGRNPDIFRLKKGQF